MRGAVVTLLLAGCGRFSFDTHGDAGNHDASQLLDGGAVGCNGIARLADDFSVDRRAQLWQASYANGSTTATVGGNALTFNLEPNAANTYVAFLTSRYYDLRGERMFTGLQHPANTTATCGVGLNVAQNVYAHVEVSNGEAVAAQDLGSGYTTLATASYDQVAMRYLALSERGGRLYFETSPDGVTFDVLYDELDPFDLSLVDVAVFAGTSQALATPGTAVFDQFNGGTPAPPDACKAETLVDTFDDGVQGRLWGSSFADACCTDTEPGGQLLLTADGSIGYVGRLSSAAYDLRDSEVVVATTGPTQSTIMYGAVTARIDQNNYLSFEDRQSGYNCNATVNGVLTQVIAPRVSGDAYLRLRETAGTVYFEASSDRATWRVLQSLATPLDLSEVLIGLEAGEYIAGNPNSVAFDDLNAP